MSKILIIEDEVAIADLEKDYLGPMRYGVRAVLFDPCNIAPPGMLRVASWVEIEGMIETLNRSAVA